MEILSQTTSWFEYIFAIVALGGFSLLLIVVFIGFLLTSYKHPSDVTAGIGIFIAIIAFAGLTVMGVNQGPDVTYKATITDFNEVYTQGYEIIGKDGKIYTLRESEAE